MKKVYVEVAKAIKPGEKYTLFGHNNFGFPVTLHTRIHKAYIGSYAQYKDVLVIEHQPKRKRTVYRKHILPYQSFYIWEGWFDIDNDFWHVEHLNDMTITSSKYSSFDNQYLNNTVQKIKVKPVAILDRDYHTKVDEIDFLYKVVAEEGVKYYSLPELQDKYSVAGSNERGRIELQGQPNLVGLFGPMFDGYEDGKAIIRYETQEVQNLLSS